MLRHQSVRLDPDPRAEQRKRREKQVGGCRFQGKHAQKRVGNKLGNIHRPKHKNGRGLIFGFSDFL